VATDSAGRIIKPDSQGRIVVNTPQYIGQLKTEAVKKARSGGSSNQTTQPQQTTLVQPSSVVESKPTTQTSVKEDIKFSDLFRLSSDTKTAKQGQFSILAPFTESKRTTAYIDQQVDKGTNKVFGNAGSKYNPVSKPSKIMSAVSPLLTKQVSVGNLAFFSGFSPLMSTSISGTKTITAKTKVITGESRNLIGTKKGITSSETEGTAILRTDISGFKKDFKIARTNSGEKSFTKGSDTITISRGTGSTFSNNKDVEGYSFKAVSKETKTGIKGVVYGKSIVQSKNLQTSEITSGRYNTGSRPLKNSVKIESIEFKETRFSSVDSSSKGSGILKINTNLPKNVESFKIFPAGKKAQFTTYQQITKPIQPSSSSGGLSATGISSQFFSQIGIKQGSSTYTAGTYGLRSPLITSSFGTFSSQFRTPSPQSSIPTISSASAPKTSLISIPSTATIPKTENIPKTITLSKTGQRGSSRTQNPPITIPKTTLVQQPVSKTPSTPQRPILRTPMILPPFSFSPNIGFGKTYKMGYMMKPQKTMRTPSLTAIGLNIKSPKTFRFEKTGIGIRPMISGKRKKKKK